MLKKWCRGGGCGGSSCGTTALANNLVPNRPYRRDGDFIKHDHSCCRMLKTSLWSVRVTVPSIPLDYLAVVWVSHRQSCCPAILPAAGDGLISIATSCTGENTKGCQSRCRCGHPRTAILPRARRRIESCQPARICGRISIAPDCSCAVWISTEVVITQAFERVVSMPLPLLMTVRCLTLPILARLATAGKVLTATVIRVVDTP